MVVSVARICDPELYRLKEAVEQARINAETIPGFEMRIVRYLQELCLSKVVPLVRVFRGLEVLSGMHGGGTRSEMGDEKRLIGLMRPFLRSSDPQVASKCVLLLARQSNNIDWLCSVMAETDARIRANLIEALWKRSQPEVERLLRGALHDPHPRVTANAAYGLYILGAEGWVEGLERLLSSSKPSFRKSGIWLLKETGAPDAPERIRLSIRDPDAGVRRAAFDALIHFRQRGGAKKQPGIESSAAA